MQYRRGETAKDAYMYMYTCVRAQGDITTWNAPLHSTLHGRTFAQGAADLFLAAFDSLARRGFWDVSLAVVTFSRF